MTIVCDRGFLSPLSCPSYWRGHTISARNTHTHHRLFPSESPPYPNKVAGVRTIGNRTLPSPAISSKTPPHFQSLSPRSFFAMPNHASTPHSNRITFIFRSPHSGVGRRGSPWFVPICSDFPVCFQFVPICTPCFREYPDLFWFVLICSDLLRCFRTNQGNPFCRPLLQVTKFSNFKIIESELHDSYITCLPNSYFECCNRCPPSVCEFRTHYSYIIVYTWIRVGMLPRRLPYIIVREAWTWATAVRRGSYKSLFFFLNSDRLSLENKGNSVLNFGLLKNPLNCYGPSSLAKSWLKSGRKS